MKNPPAGFHTVTPYLVLKDVSGFLEFVSTAFDAVILERIYGLDRLATFHAQVQIGTSILMVGEMRDGAEASPGMLYLYVEDADAIFKRAVDAGGKVLMPVTDMFYGDRHGGVEDKWGNSWWIATHREDVRGEELQRRNDAEMRRREKA